MASRNSMVLRMQGVGCELVIKKSKMFCLISSPKLEESFIGV